MFDTPNVASDASPLRTVEVGTLRFSFPKAFPLDQDLLTLSVRPQHSPPGGAGPHRFHGPEEILPPAARKPLLSAGSIHAGCSVPASKGPCSGLLRRDLRAPLSAGHSAGLCLPSPFYPHVASYHLQATFTITSQRQQSPHSRVIYTHQQPKPHAQADAGSQARKGKHPSVFIKHFSFNVLFRGKE